MKHKKLLIAGLAIALLIGIVSAATIQWFGRVKMTATVNQAVLVDGKSYPDVIDETATVGGGESFCSHHYLTSQTSVPVKLQFDTTYSPELTDDEITVTYRYYVLEKFTPTIDGELDDGYRLVVTDEETEVGCLPIEIYVACDDGYMYWFFKATAPTTEEQGIGDTSILWNAEHDGEWLMVYLQEVVYDNEGIWTGTPMPDTALDRHCYMVDSVEIYDTLEVKIPRSYAECLGWTYDAWAWGGGARNTGWGTTSYGDIGPGDFLDCPCKECGELLTLPLTLEPYERVDFCICYKFTVNIAPGTYTITTEIKPA